MYFLGIKDPNAGVGKQVVSGVPPKARRKAYSHQSKEGPYLDVPGLWAVCHTPAKKDHGVSMGISSTDISQLPLVAWGITWKLQKDQSSQTQRQGSAGRSLMVGTRRWDPPQPAGSLSTSSVPRTRTSSSQVVWSPSLSPKVCVVLRA